MTTRQPTILLVEDDTPTREMYRSALRIAGFDVLLAPDGLAALRQVEEVVPDAVVLDLDLPQVSGVAINDELAAQPRTAHVPVVVVTGTDWRPRHPPAAILIKPINADELVATLRRLLRRRDP